MSGKTTYMNQIALITIMAQMGCFVPCVFASIRLTDNLLSRIGRDNGIEVCYDIIIQANSSSFTIEMRETAFILEQITDSSLVIIDELGRGTSNLDGLAVNIAACEELLESKAFVFIVTHFTELPIFFADSTAVVSLHLQVSVCLSLPRRQRIRVR